MTVGFAKVSIKGEGMILVGVVLFTLTFDSSPIKGEGMILVGVVLFTLTLVLSHQGRRGYWLVVLSCCHPALWILDLVQNDGV